MPIYGWDMSHFDAPSLGTAVAEGIGFVTHKAGGDANDAEIGTWWRNVQDIRTSGVLLGAYWVLYPGTPVARADAFLARLDAQCPGWRDGPFILQADCEKWNGDAGTVPSIGEINAFCDRLAERVPKLNPIVYAPKWVYGDRVGALRYPLWASSYVTAAGGFKALYPGDSSSHWGSYGGRQPSILQYSSSATIGGQTTSDANAFRGTLAQLTDLVAPGWSDDVAFTDADKTWIQAQIAVVTAFDKPQDDGTPTSKIGRLALTQGVPNGTKSGAPRDQAWQVLEDLGVQLMGLRADVAAIEPASSVTIDYAALAQALAAAIPAQLADQVADVLAQRLSA